MRIHILSNSFYVNSGFSKAAFNIGLGLKKLGHDVTATGFQTAMKSDWYYGIETLPIDAGSHIDEIGQLYLNLQKTNPDVLIYIGQMDTDTNHFTKVFGKTICYSPVEGRNIGTMMTNDLKYIISHGGYAVAHCNFGQEEMRKVGVNAGVIYHGYDPLVFYKIKNTDKFEPYCYYRTEIGKINTDPVELHKMGCYDCNDKNWNDRCNGHCQYCKEEIVSFLRWDSTDKRWMQIDIGISKLKDELKGREKRFTYLFVGQNNGLRKRIEKLLRSYAMLISESKQLKDRTHLHLHTFPISIKGVNLIKVVSDLGIADNVTFSYGTFRSSGWSEQGLNVLYNLADVNVSASSSEGFGMPILESMVCGVPNIGPDCTSFTELIGNDSDWSKNRGWLAKIESWHMILDSSERALVDEKDLALKMKMAYVEKDKMKVFSKNAEEWAKDYRLSEVCKQWDNLLKEII